MKKHVITLSPSGKKKTFQKNILVSDALLEMGILLKTPCGGKGFCGKCKVNAEGLLSEKTEHEQKIVGDEPTLRLACQASLQGDVRIDLDEAAFREGMLYPKVNPNKEYGIAVDIGTTTVQISLVDISDGKSYLINSFFNPQRRFGHDVISRIAASHEPDRFHQLIHLIREEIFTSIRAALDATHLLYEKIQRIVISGNTTMLHFFFGIDVLSIGVYPYLANRLDFNGLKLQAMKKFPHAELCGMPALSAFVGGDLLGGLGLIYDEGYRSNIFFIDLGTNGELFLINSAGEIFATSCAMGPALEGMNISYGMSAEDGAITHVRDKMGKLEYEMAEQGVAVGITGTALIDLISIFLQKGIISREGAFAKDMKNLPFPAQYESKDNSSQINLWEDIMLTQKDIRNVQLAKGASLAAAKILLKAAKISSSAIDHVIVAGALGKHLDLDNFKKLNFIPEFSKAEYHVLGNTSIKAAEKACIDIGFLKRITLLKKKVHSVELSMDPRFNEEFIASLNFW